MTSEQRLKINRALDHMTGLGYLVRVNGTEITIEDSEGRAWSKYPVSEAAVLCDNILAFNHARVASQKKGTKYNVKR